MGCRRLFIFILCLQIIVSLLNSYSILIFNLISALFVSRYLYSKMDGEGFRGGAVVESLPANAGDTGSGPGPGGSHMPRSSWARAPQLLSLRCRAHVPQLLKPVRLEPVLCTKRSHRNEKPMHSNEDAAQPKIINK